MKLAPCLMFVGDQCGRAEEAIELYTSVFQGSRVLSLDRWEPESGEQGVMHARVELAGHEIALMDSGAPHQFTFTPSISLFVDCDDAQLDAAWDALSGGGRVLMPLGEYPFSPKFGWCNDRFGVSWQLRLAEA
jgi:predicted 3-demethylubiquinone-9 3-methyltransferase (glyoxalase superfamily)